MLFAARCGLQGFLGPPHFHYVAPSFWAWRGGEERLKRLSSFVDHILCILPFEAETCRAHGLNATFVGHPTLEDVLDFEGKDCKVNRGMVQGNGEEFRSKHGISPGSTIISLLPGSRLLEVTRMLPIFSEAMKLLKNSFPDIVTVVHVAPNQHVEDYLTEEVREWPTRVVLIPGGSPHAKYNSFSASKVALCTSGTVAMELQLARLPCVVAYRAHFVTEWVIRQKAKVKYISLPNILLDSAVIPEALFQACTPSLLASLLEKLVSDERLRMKQITAAEEVMRLVSPPDCNPIEQEVPQHSVAQTPSMVAASTVLNCRVNHSLDAFIHD